MGPRDLMPEDSSSVRVLSVSFLNVSCAECQTQNVYTKTLILNYRCFTASVFLETFFMCFYNSQLL